VPWEIFLATLVLVAIALVSGERLSVQWNMPLVIVLLASSTLGLVVPYWAIASAGRGLSANTVSLGMLGAPLIGIAAAAIVLGEEVGLAVWIAVLCVIGGVAVAHLPSSFGRN